MPSKPYQSKTFCINVAGRPWKGLRFTQKLIQLLLTATGVITGAALMNRKMGSGYCLSGK
jgi:hypothetical protein